MHRARPGEDGGEPGTGPGGSAKALLFSQASRSNRLHSGNLFLFLHRYILLLGVFIMFSFENMSLTLLQRGHLVLG